MGFVVTVTIYCNEPLCPKFVERTRSNKGGLSKTWAGYLAREVDGWFTGGHPGGPSDPKVAYCPDHKAKHGKA